MGPKRRLFSVKRHSQALQISDEALANNISEHLEKELVRVQSKSKD
jgi:hypothetical protein